LASNAYVKKRTTPYIFIVPMAVLLVLFLVYPIFVVINTSFKSYILNKPDLNGYIGIKNYHVLLTEDRYFYTILWVSIKWILATVSIQLVIGLTGALLLNKKFKGRSFFRVLFFMPWAMSGILTSQLFALMYNQTIGLFNSVLLDFHLITSAIAFTGNEHLVFMSVVIAEVWRGFPFFVIILLASLQSVNTELFDSAHVDGAGPLMSFWYITLPHIKETLLFAILLRAIWEFNNVDVIFNITGGGPAYMTTTLSMYIVRNILKLGDYGYGSALTVFSSIILLGFVLLYFKLSNSSKKESNDA
jgi:multiple sugar transport system permease protein